MILYWSSIVAMLGSVGGCGYLIWTMLLVRRFSRTASSAPTVLMPGVTILKPLHGAEPGLLESLASFCSQNYPGPVQIVFGVQDPGDEAIATVRWLQMLHGADRIALVIDATMHGANRKVSNLINMWRCAEHEIIVLADSDIRVDPGYVSRVVIALQERDVGAVTCPYHGVAVSGVWSRLVELGINAHFLPNVILAVAVGLAHPCFGSTIALKRRTLAKIGGFIAIANYLADDYAIGARLRALGYKVAVLPVTVGHMCEEASAAELWQHEVRWARTIRAINPLGYTGSIAAHPFALALIAALAGVGVGTVLPVIAIGLCITSLGCRLALLRLVERAFYLPVQPYWLLPLRDLLSFAVFLSGIIGRNVNWRGRDFRFMPNGTLLAIPPATRDSRLRDLGARVRRLAFHRTR
jgi:ceramide glucosyltransferase